MYNLRAITEPLMIGEGPHWDHNQQALYFVDLLEKSIHKYVLATGKHTKTTLEDGANFIIPVDGTYDQFVVGAGRRFLIIRWDGEDDGMVDVVREIGKVDQQWDQNRINDGKVDPRGRLFAGTMHWPENLNTIEYDKGSLYCITPLPNGDISLQVVAEKITLSNGLAWDLKKKAFYYIDSLEYKIRRYDYDVETGNISNQTYVFDLRLHDTEGIPDGMTMDTDGNLWIAVFGGSCVLKVDPMTGKLLEKIPIPVKHVTSVTFGGPNYDVLFVTTASKNLGEKAQPPPCGAIYMITGLGVKGHSNVNYKV